MMIIIHPFNLVVLGIIVAVGFFMLGRCTKNGK